MSSRYVKAGLFAAVVFIHWLVLSRSIFTARELIQKGKYIQLQVSTYQGLVPGREQYIHWVPAPMNPSVQDSSWFAAGESVRVCFMQDTGDGYSFREILKVQDEAAVCPVYLDARVQSVYPLPKIEGSTSYQVQLDYNMPPYFIGLPVDDRLIERLNLALADTSSRFYLGAFYADGRLWPDALYLHGELIHQQRR
jgi:hypothetical protein